MELKKKADRILKVQGMTKALKQTGAGTMRNLGTYCKWKNLPDGQLQVKMTIYEVKYSEGTAYFMADTLDRICTSLNSDLDDMRGWLREHGYKTEKKWYLEDYGMDEDTWNEWNGIEG